MEKLGVKFIKRAEIKSITETEDGRKSCSF